MLNIQIKKWVFLWIILLIAFQSFAQQDHFVYLQTDNGKPFYVRMDNKILSSSSEGYVILPNITNGVYKISVGFPKNEYPEETFTVTVDNNNEGFLVKHFDENGLQLFNLETLALITGNRDTATRTLATTVQDNNAFTKLLADVVKDSSILQNHEVKVDIPSKLKDSSETASSIASPDSSKALNDTSSLAITKEKESTEIITAPVSGSESKDSATGISNNTSVSKILSKNDKNGLQMIYSDINGEKKDTIRVFIPVVKHDSLAGSEATNKKDFELSSSQNKDKAQTDTSSQLTIAPTEVQPKEEKEGFILRKDTILAVEDHAKASGTETAPEQVFYIGPKEKSSDDTAQKPVEEKKGLFSGLTSSKKDEDETPKKEQKAVNKIEVLPKVVTSSAVNSDCKAFADNMDFLRLRKKMASEDNKESMIKVANKSFKSKCFSTAQIKDLSYLFLTEEGKYMFFDAAYAHTSDSDQYSSLEPQLKDPYYRSRFEAMIRH